MTKPLYSIIIPVLNEEESLNELFENINKTFEAFKKSFEVIFIDDGSTDKTLEIIKGFEKKHNNIRIFSFRRNLGKSNALTLGFHKSRGDFVVTMDADLQDDPDNIPTLEKKLLSNNLDLVTGWRKTRRDSIYKIVTSKVFNSLVSHLFGIKIHDLNSGLKIYRAEVAGELNIYGGMHRFIPVLANEMGYRVGEQEITHSARKYGKSKYKASKVLTDLPDLLTIYFLTKYTRRPLHFFGKVGIMLFGIGMLLFVYLSALHFSGTPIGDRPLLLVSIVFIIAGIQTVFTGLLADFISHSNSRLESTDLPLKYATDK